MSRIIAEISSKIKGNGVDFDFLLSYKNLYYVTHNIVINGWINSKAYYNKQEDKYMNDFILRYTQMVQKLINDEKIKKLTLQKTKL